jgi:hypothetical protein
MVSMMTLFHFLAVVLLQVLSPVTARPTATHSPGLQVAATETRTLDTQTYKATLHFAGLVLFTSRAVRETNAVPINSSEVAHQVMAYMPSVKSGLHAHARQANFQQQVEDHTAVIAFNPGDLLAVSGGWQTQILRSNLSYIELIGEHISFVADGANRIAQIDSRLPHVGGAQLLSQYRSAPGAAAVFEIPYGKLSACMADVADHRVDTKLTLENHGTITIKADNGKSATFKGGATIRLANMPMAWLISMTGSANEASHYTVYCQMTGDTQCAMGALSSPISEVCGDPSLVMLPPPGVRIGTNSTQSSDVFCSNTQWP